MSDTRGTGRFIVAAALAAAAVAVSGCDVLVQSIDGGGLGGGVKATDTWTKSYSVGSKGVEVIVVNVNGRIQVEASSGATVEVKAELTARAGSEEAAKELLKQVEIRDEASPTRVRIETRNKRTFGRQGVNVVYTLRVPKAVTVNLETANGTISVTGVEGGTRAESSNGGIEGRLLGGSVKASTTNGSIKVDLMSVGEAGTELETTNGSIEVRLSDAAKANLVARCVNGGISVDGLTFEKTGEGTRRKLDGRLNGGGPTLRADTVNGAIRFRKLS
jgi:Putative adhesin